MRYFNHLLLTESFFIKGHVSTGTRRLSTYLNDMDKPFVEVGHPAIINCTDGSESQSERVLLRFPDLLLAFELEDTGHCGERIPRCAALHYRQPQSHRAGPAVIIETSCEA